MAGLLTDAVLTSHTHKGLILNSRIHLPGNIHYLPIACCNFRGLQELPFLSWRSHYLLTAGCDFRGFQELRIRLCEAMAAAVPSPVLELPPQPSEPGHPGGGAVAGPDPQQGWQRADPPGQPLRTSPLPREVHSALGVLSPLPQQVFGALRDVWERLQHPLQAATARQWQGVCSCGKFGDW